MLFINIHTILHDPSQLYMWEEIEDGKIERMYTPDEVPRDWVYSDNGDYDAYSLIIWGQGVSCVKQQESYVNIEVETDVNIFDITNHIDRDLDFESTSELFDDWAARRCGSDYYLYVRIFTVSKTLSQRYIDAVLHYLNEKSYAFKLLESISSPVDEERQNAQAAYAFDVSSKDIINFENGPYRTIECVSWSIEFPEYEGGGESGQILIAMGAAAIPTILSYHDAIQLSTETATEQECALRVLASVISHPSERVYICDAGSKCLGLDQGAHGNTSIKGYGIVKGHPELTVAGLSEEVGKLHVYGETTLKVGDRIEIIPNHSCSSANLTNFLVGVRGDEVDHLISVDVRSNSTRKNA